jgi:hypothetical protein
VDFECVGARSRSLKAQEIQVGHILVFL